jgi:hypothetical protein
MKGEDHDESDKLRWEKFHVKHEALEQSAEPEQNEDGGKETKNYLPLPLIAAAIMMLILLLLTFFPSPSPSDSKRLKSDIKSSSKEIPAEAKMIDIPNDPKGESLSLIYRAIATEKQFPKHESVLIPELLNSFSIEINSMVLLHSGCQLGVEILPSPWRPSGCLVIVKFKAGKSGSRNIALQYNALHKSVMARRLLGYTAVAKASEISLNAKLEAENAFLFVLEVESRDFNLGKLLWSIDGVQAPEMELVHDPSHEPSSAARLISLISAFGLWLRAENSVIIDDALVLGLAREISPITVPKEQYDFLGLVDEAIKLKGQASPKY